MHGLWNPDISQGSEDNAYSQGATSRPRVVKRGMDEFNIDDGEPEKVDHLLFLVHGIGSVCDLKFRTVEEVGKFQCRWNKLLLFFYPNTPRNRIEEFTYQLKTTFFSQWTNFEAYHCNWCSHTIETPVNKAL